MSQWTLFSNHGHVLVVLSRDPDARLRDVAQVVGITERAVQKIVRDLQDGGMISIEKQGRRNRYLLHGDVPLRHPLESHCASGDLLALVNLGAPEDVTTASPLAPAEPKDPVTRLPAQGAAMAIPESAPVAEGSLVKSSTGIALKEAVPEDPEPEPVEVDRVAAEKTSSPPVTGNGGDVIGVSDDSLDPFDSGQETPLAADEVEVAEQINDQLTTSEDPVASDKPAAALKKPTRRKKKAIPDDPESIDPGDQGSLF